MAPDLRTLRHEVELDASAQTVFDVLMDQDHHAAFTGMEAVIDWREGGRFVTCGERAFGFNLVLVPGRKIVQAWGHADFPQHHYSVVTIDLEPRGHDRTRLLLEQTGVPAQAVDAMEQLWSGTYWEPLKRYLRELESAA